MTMNRTEAKEKAQEIIMDRVAQANYALWDERGYYTDIPDEDKKLVEEYLTKQKERIEKMFGYEPGAWQWG